MPDIRLTTNLDMTPDARLSLAQKLTAIVSKILGKEEKWILVHVQDGQTMTFGGTTDPLAQLSLASLGLSDDKCPDLARELTEVLVQELKLDPQRIFMEFSSPPRERFAWNGKTFG